jgi:hypothetical protein
MTLDAESIKRQIPFYLSSEDKRALVENLWAISKGEDTDYILSNYYNDFQDQMLQGDGWRGLLVYSFETNEVRPIRGIILSNSCDVDPSNKRDLPVRLSFAPWSALTN